MSVVSSELQRLRRMGIKEIAEAAGVSPSAVSLALNNRPGVSEETRARVVSIAESMRYRHKGTEVPSGFAARRGTIRFLKVIKHGRVLNENHKVFVADYIEGMAKGCREHRFYLQFVSHNTDRIEEALPKSKAIRGVIVLGTELEESDLEMFCDLHIPAVFLDTYHEHLPLDFVDMDNFDAMHKIVARLYECGHREIGYVRCNIRTRNLAMREEAFLAALARFGLAHDPEFIFGVDSTYHGAYRDMLEILKAGKKLPTAFFPGNDIIAYGCLKAMKEFGLHIPGDVSVIGFDDLPTSAVMDPPLTTIRVATRQMGAMAVDLLAVRLEQPDIPPMKLQIGVDFIERQSVKRIAASPAEVPGAG